MVQTPLTRRLGLRHPIIQAPLAGGGDTPDLVSAVAEAGALGFIGATYLTPAQIADVSAAVRQRTSRPFGINLFAPQPQVAVPAHQVTSMMDRLAPFYRELGVPQPDKPSVPADAFDEQLAAALDSGASVFSFTLGIFPPSAIAAIRRRNMFVIGTATTVDEARELEAIGVDAVVVQGSEAGGHRATFRGSFEAGAVGTMALVPQVVDAVSVPVIASGGIMDGRGIAAALVLGASAVQMGTAFLTCDEAGIPGVYKDAILGAREDQTRLTTAFSGRPARGIVNRFMDAFATVTSAEIPPFPLQNALTGPLRRAAAKQGRPEFLSLWAGQGSRLARRQSAEALIARLADETADALRRGVDFSARTTDADPTLIAFHEATGCAADYLRGLPARAVAPVASALAGLSHLGGPLPERGVAAADVIALLHRQASPATVATAGPRYFGFVTGGALPAALGAAVLAAAWDQNAALEVMSPAAAALEKTAAQWLVDVLGLPGDCEVGFTTGATTANFTALAAARYTVLRRAGWDVTARGLFGAPEVLVIVGDEVHATVLKALDLLGLGRTRVLRLPTDDQGRIRPTSFPTVKGPAILCLQAGNVNTGAFDPFRELVPAAHAEGAWVHIDGAFGLWALASSRLAPLADGAALADSWATDAHKALNTPYDCGLAIVRSGEALKRAMGVTASYLAAGTERDGAAFVPEFSRRARGVEVWAALRSLGRRGVGELIERTVALAERFATGMRMAGFDVLNEVVFNQALVSFGTADRTRRVIAALQAEGTCWCGGTVWQGRTAMRVSVSSWATTEDDIDRSIDAVRRVAAAVA